MQRNDDDPYVYPGTDVLKNTEGIRDREALDEFERLVTANRAEFLPRYVTFTVESYLAIHRYLFHEVYDWAGELRTVDIARDASLFCRARYIRSELNKRFAKLAVEDHLRGLDPLKFAERGAEHASELNAIYPFRDGNGRTLRAFLECLGDNAGHPLDLSALNPADWRDASIAGFVQDYEKMRRVIAAAISSA